MSTASKQRLMAEYKTLDKEKWLNIELSDGGIFKWVIGIMVINPESAFDGGYFQTEMTFTDKYPYSPPTFKFLRPIYHPNIYPDGRVCISILHPPGEDEQSGELASERWSPLQGVESVLRSVLLLLDDPEIASPANVDAGVMYRDNRALYNSKAQDAVKASKKDIPAGFVMPTTLESAPPEKITEDDNFWNESGGEEDDFGASDSSGDDFGMDDDEEEEGEDEEEDEA
ncbi:UBC-like protein [Glarea lozoyensis ATCC 20868]|uniref:Ubiquitin-conjugating enzyme E2 2 n=1 Tax=Glarea lozoyensis (strain ATCC 20868 / MF5171) TaxID=1116229 RepID=S3DC30_GLAL2|nr:UBC-like protein [Glarea lozoyensis ATCC 20868]EPE34654.1 UBC-like protein [Glarea lozoyensis ATCC 20868]